MSNYVITEDNGKNKGMAYLKGVYLYLYYLTSTPMIREFTQVWDVLFMQMICAPLPKLKSLPKAEATLASALSMRCQAITSRINDVPI